MRWLARTAVSLALALTCRPASAVEPARVALEFSREDAAGSSCPDEATFRGLVAARLGYDPFVARAPLLLAVSFRRNGSVILGHLSLTGENGVGQGERSLRSRRDDCYELAASMALAAAVAVDPDAVRSRSKQTAPPESAAPPLPSSEPLPAPEPPPRAEVPEVPTAARSAETDRVGLHFIAGGGVVSRVVPAFGAAARTGLALRWPRWSLGGEGAFLFPTSRSIDAGEVSAFVVHGSVVPCGHARLGNEASLDLCVAVSLGIMRSDAAGVTRAQPASDVFATAGPRAGFTVMPSEAFGFRLAAELPLSLSRIHLVIDDRGTPREVWASEALGLVANLSLVFRLR